MPPMAVPPVHGRAVVVAEHPHVPGRERGDRADQDRLAEPQLAPAAAVPKERVRVGGTGAADPHVRPRGSGYCGEVGALQVRHSRRRAPVSPKACRPAIASTAAATCAASLTSAAAASARSYCRDWTIAQVLSHLGSGGVEVRGADVNASGVLA